jgi:hypothetical protein
MSSKSYQFTLDASGAVTAVYEIKNGKTKLDLSAIDAKAGFTKNDSFTFIGSAADLTQINANGAVWFENGVVYASTDRDLAAEFQIELTGVTSVTAADFVL